FSTSLLFCDFFFFYCYRDHRDLHSFPTRRSSDLAFADGFHPAEHFDRVGGIVAVAAINGSELPVFCFGFDDGSCDLFRGHSAPRSEEHTSELQSLAYLVCRLLLEKKKKIQQRRFA